MEAISHAKKHLLPLKSKYPKEVKELAALLAFSPDVDYTPYHVRANITSATNTH